MLEELIDKLEKNISVIENRMEEDADFAYEKEFEMLYEKLINEFTMIKEQYIEGFPYDTASEKKEDLFIIQKNRFNKAAKRIKSIEDEAEIDAGQDSDWMFDGEED